MSLMNLYTFRLDVCSVLAGLVKRDVHDWLKPVSTNRWVWIVMLTLSGWICCADPQAADVEEPFRVMILRNTSEYIPATILQDRGMREAFTALGTRNVQFFVETMNTMWFNRSEIEPEFLSLFRKKYSGRKIDLLMAAGADALNVAQRFREVLLPGVPIVFYNVAEDALRGTCARTGYYRGRFAVQSSWNAGPRGASAAGCTAYRRCKRDLAL